MGLDAEVGETGHQLVGGGEAEAEFLHDIGAGVVEQAAVDGEDAELGQVVVAIVHEFLGHLEVAFFAAVEAAVLQRIAEGVEGAGTLQVGGVEALLLGILHIELEEREIILGAHEVDADSVDIDALEEGGHVVDALDALGAEAQGGGSAFDGVEGDAVGFLKVVDADVLAHFPHVVVGMLATGEGFLAGVAVEVLEAFEVFGAVVGFHLEALDGLPDEFLLVVGTFEVFVNHLFPFLGGDGWEFAEQFVVFHYVVSFICFYCKRQRYEKSLKFKDYSLKFLFFFVILQSKSEIHECA